MAAADHVDPELKKAIHECRKQTIRCLKITVQEPPKTEEDFLDEDIEDAGQIKKDYKLVLVEKLTEEPGVALDREFMRCVTKKVEPKTCHMFLFRTNENENVEGGRWLLIVWLPLDAVERRRALFVRSRSMLTRMVPQPYFLTEMFAKDHRNLTWAAAREQGVLFGGGVGKTSREAAGGSLQIGIESTHNKPENVPGNKVIAPRPAPVKISEKTDKVLSNFGMRLEICIRLSTGKENLVQRGRGATEFDVKSEDCKTPFALAQHALPGADCFFAMHVKDALFFIFWCPDVNQKDSTRVSDDIRHAALKASVSRLVMQACVAGKSEGDNKKPRLVTIDAREPQDIVDGAAGQPIGGGDRGRSRTSVRVSPEADISNALGGNAFGVYCDDKPAGFQNKDIKSTLTLPERPFPTWRGGSKAHTIVSTATSQHQSGGRQDLKAPNLGVPGSKSSRMGSTLGVLGPGGESRKTSFNLDPDASRRASERKGSHMSGYTDARASSVRESLR